MHGLGTIVNVAAIVVGGLVGLLGGRRIPERLQKTLMSAMGATELPAARSRHAKKLYKNVASSPAKMITRYSRICPYSSCGICRKRKIASRNA